MSRRTMGRRAWSLPIVVALLSAVLPVVVVPVAAQAAPVRAAVACRAVPLPLPAGATYSAVAGGDPTGRYLVGSTVLTGESAPTGLVWTNNRVTRIDAGSIQHVAVYYTDVNRSGVVVGQRMTDTTTFHTDAFTYRSGRFTMLPPLKPGDSTEAVAINSRGDVVGNSWTPEGEVRLVVWPADRPGTVRALRMADGRPAEAYAADIDEDRTVVGYLRPNPPGTPYVWPAVGRPRPLEIPEGSMGGGATAIRLGVVAGNVLVPVDPSSQLSAPIVWNLRTGQTTRHPVGLGSVLSVNRWGTVGTIGAIIHADGRVVPVGDQAAVEVVTDRGDAAGTTAPFYGQAVRWLHC